MVIIQLTDNVDWYRANWIYRQLITDIVDRNPGDEELSRKLKYGQAIGALFVNNLQEPVRSRVLKALKITAADTISGKIEGWNPSRRDVEGRKMYLESMRELSATIVREFPDII